MAPLAAALWLLGLLAAAPALRATPRYAFIDRLRDALLLGCAIPLLLGALHLLSAPACWALLALALIVALVRGPIERVAAPIPYATVVVLALVAWPALIRPLLDGDSLAYHLPIAASWVQAHSLWSTATRYWWYPAASESFAAALYAVAGPFAVGWSGLAAAALLGWRIATTAREHFNAPPLLADALAAATLASLPLALQAGTLQNDVWLAALFVEALFATPIAAAAFAAAACALVKPYGWIFAILAVWKRPRWPFVLAPALAIGAWIARDALLWRTASIAPASTHFGDGSFATSILAHGWSGLATLLAVGAQHAPFALFAWLAALAAPAFVRDRRLAIAATVAALLFLVMPFGFNNGLPQLAIGASLRFAAPAVALGALVLAPALRRFSTFASVVLGLFALRGVAATLAIFWNDGATHTALAVAAIAVLLAYLARRRGAWIPAGAFAIAVALAVHLAGAHPLDYYRDTARARGESSGLYAYLAHAPIAAIAGWGLRIGVVNVLAPQIRTFDLADVTPCLHARRDGAVLVAFAQPGPPERNALRLAAARRCGAIRYDDGLAVVAVPSY